MRARGAALFVALAVLAIPAAPSQAATISGVAKAGGVGLGGAEVRAWKAGSRPESAAVVAKGRTNSKGTFRLTVSNAAGNDVLYLTTYGGRRAGRRAVPSLLQLASAIGEQRPTRVALNERTTVATGFALAQFLSRGKAGGTNPGLANATAMVRNVVRTDSGAFSELMLRPPNGAATSTIPTVNTLANILASCSTDAAVCRRMAALAGTPGGGHAASTLQVVGDIAANASRNAARLFALQGSTRLFRPRLTNAPTSWLLGVKFVGDGSQFRGPGNMAFDASGDAWTTNNYVPSSDPAAVCPGTALLKLSPYSPDSKVTAYTGGGVNGAGFGIGIDPSSRVWIGNFGFEGRLCALPEPSANSVSAFDPSGAPISDPAGYVAGPIRYPQGTVSDRKGTIWITNCGSGSLARYPNGDPGSSLPLITGTTDQPMRDPFDVVIDRAGNAWVTSSASNQVFAFGPDGTPLAGSPYSGGGLAKPLGIATDRLGNQWVANSGVVPIPCGPRAGRGEFAEKIASEPLKRDGTITRVSADGTTSRLAGGGLTVPWGIATDGDGNVWVANFGGRRFSEFCGATASACPAGSGPGRPISPATGYSFNGLQRNTGITIDASGSVWLANNWKNVPPPENPGGDGLVAFLGMAAPVAMPLIGPPERP